MARIITSPERLMKSNSNKWVMDRRVQKQKTPQARGLGLLLNVVEHHIMGLMCLSINRFVFSSIGISGHEPQ